MSTINDTPKSAPESIETLPKRPTLSNLAHQQADHQSFCVVKRLSKAKFPVYLAMSKTTKQPYALKIFPYVDEYSNKYFHNEARFSFLNHPNIIKFIHCEKERKTVQKGKTKDASYILMEYAPYGDFFNLVTKHKDQIDEKLARTYFRQLIDGIEYLHENGIAHLDLKPENLLLGEDFNLKIIDFDLSYMDGDPKVLSNGTKFYRGPEFFRTKVKSTYAADIYSAGVFLFIMKSGGMYPHAEDDGPDHGEFVDLMYQDNKKFWDKHCEMENKDKNFYDCNFKQLFNSMVKENPNQRCGIKQVKKSKWYNGPVYSSEELYHKMKKLVSS